MAFFYILGVIIWIALAFWPATIARRKGYSFLGFLIVSIFFWWITLFVALFMKDRTQTATSRADDRAASAALDRDEQGK